MMKPVRGGLRVIDWGFGIVSSRAAPLVAILSVLAPVVVHADEPSAAGLEFFETRIRPIFFEHCYECHGGAQVKGGLRLNSLSGFLAGGDSGPAVVAGKPEESLLVEAVRYDGSIQMPPTGKLPEEKIRLIARWVAMGAPAPRVSAAKSKTTSIDLDARRQFWAYRPVKDWPAPETHNGRESASPIDRFILSHLEAAGVSPQAEAERTVLVRRLYFDLVGRPPTPQEIDQFLNDTTTHAYEQLVERLLDSPQFGERWGRHWLDVVRFAESLTLRGFILPEAWRYRDYVIESFNSDRPYDEFVRQQIAGDLLPAESVEARQRNLIATTFLALGNTNLEEQDKRQLDMDVVDEQLDVLGKAILGQTIGCARCHDHKFDPIPIRDYYALAGIFRSTQLLEHANVSKWVELPLPLPTEDEAQFHKQEAAIAALQGRIADVRNQLVQLEEAQLGRQAGPAVVAASALVGIVVDDRQAKRVGTWQESQYSKRYIGDGYIHDLDQGKGEKTLSFVPELPRNGRYEIRLAYTAGTNRSDRVPVSVFSADGEKLHHVNMRQPPPLDGRWISLGQYGCEAAGQNFVLVSNDGTSGHVIADAVQYLPVDDALAGQTSVDAAEKSPEDESPEIGSRRTELNRLEKELAERRNSARKRPMVMTVIERTEVTDAPIHVRGSVHSLGEVVPRGFLQVIRVPGQLPLPTNESGRRELAAWITDRRNPLTARVMVNRVWHWLMGEGLVRTVDNFGTTGETPTHPELLDHLATRFAAEGWSVKKLVRSIALSAAYRRSSEESAIGRRIDPENRLLWRASRKRLDAECLRDAMLLVAGQLDWTAGGPTIRAGVTADFDYVDRDFRRSVYVPVLRNALPELFEVFDFPDPSSVVGRRNRSTVAPQALYMMNHPFVRERAAAAARRLLAERSQSTEEAIGVAFRETLGRMPSTAEAVLARQVVGTSVDHSGARGWTDLYQVLFASLDFRYCD
jgi:hypothetical protein